MLRDVTLGNLRYFRELLAGSEEGIASNILADRLKRLGHLRCQGLDVSPEFYCA